VTDSNTDVAAAAERFHEEVPLQFQVSLTMSIETRDRLRGICDEVNDSAGERIFDTNDAMRLALEAAARYHALATDENADTDEHDTDRLIPLTAAIHEVLEEDGTVTEASGGTD